MGIYLGLLIINIIGCLFDYSGIKLIVGKNKDTYGRIFWWVITLLFLILGVFRSPELGFDGDSYYRDYYLPARILSTKELFRLGDPVFYLCFKILVKIYENYNFVRAAIYLCTFLPCAIYIYKKSDNICFSYTIYLAANYLGFTYGILRQSFAVMLCIISWMAFKDKKRLLGIVFVALAALVHMSAAFMIIPFIILNISNEKKRYKAECLILIGILIFRQTFLLSLSNAYLGGRYSGFDETGHGYYQILAYALIAIMSVLFIRVIDRGKNYIFLELNLWILLFQILAYQMSIFGRMNNYLWILYAVEFTKSGMKKGNEQILALGIIGILSAIYLYSLVTDGGVMVPYRTIF